ncbi:MAG: diacylglycerol kinase [Gemmataceae bacterium]|nr:diacylglycerol kinase [Gemmataceae bacterium]
MTFRVVRPEPAEERPRHGLRLSGAARGVKRGARGSSRFFGHIFAATLVVLTALVLGCEIVEWAGLVLAIGLILTTELLNHSAQLLAVELKCPAAAESAAGAVLIACGTGIGAELFILGRRLLMYLAPLV